jgi:hypothetical protein
LTTIGATHIQLGDTSQDAPCATLRLEAGIPQPL